jgi:hypothetical protein
MHERSLYRNGRFLVKFQQALFREMDTSFVMTSSYHPQADGQSEKTNQVVEITLRCMIANHDAPMVGRGELSPEVQFAINIARNFTAGDLPFKLATGQSPFKLLLGTRPRDGTSSFTILPSNMIPLNSPCVIVATPGHKLKKRSSLARRAWPSIATVATHLLRSDSPLKISDLAYLKLTRKTNRGYRIPDTSSLDVIKDGPFKLLDKVGKNAFKLDSPLASKSTQSYLSYI